MSVVDASYDNTLESEEHATNPLAGGIGNQGYQCGMLWGGALAAGAQAYNLYGSGAKAESEAMVATQNLVKRFRLRTKGEVNCHEITNLHMKDGKGVVKFLIKGGPIRCFTLAGKYAQDVRKELDETYSEEHEVPNTESISCTSLLAKKMGASEMQVTMAAGLAGGIGFSGEACGALGLAIWMEAMNRPDEEVGFDVSGTYIGALTEKFLKSSDYVFECEEIVGRKFESVEDHADYICSGGCAKIIEAMAAE